MAYANPTEFEVMDEPKRSNQWANPNQFEVLDEEPAAPPIGEPTISNDPFAAFNATLKSSPKTARMPEITLPSQPVGANVTTPIQPVPQVTEAGLPVAKEVPSHGVYATETPTVINNIREGKFDDAASLAMENVMGSKPLRFFFGPTEHQKIAESVPVRKEDGSTAYEYKPASTDAVEKLGAVGAARRSIASLERGIPVTELDKAVEGEMYKEDPNDSTIKSIGKGIYNAIHRTTVSLSDPTMALIPESRLISGGFTLDMANSAKEQIQKGLESDTPQGAIEGLLGGVVTLGMAGMSGTHTLKPTKADIVKHMDVVPDELLHEASKELKTSAPDVADAAGKELMKRAADFGQELDATLKRLPGDVQEKVNGILQKQLAGEPLTNNERATLLQVRSYASKIAEEQTNAEFTSGPKPPVAPTPPTVPAAPTGTGGQSVSPRIEPAPVVDASQQGDSSALFAKAKAEAATQPLREAAAAAEETSPEVAQAAREQADLLEKRAQAQAEREKAKPTEPSGGEIPPAATVDPATEGAAVKPVEQGTKIVGPALRVPGEKDAAVKGQEGQKHSDLVREAQSSISDEHLGRVMDDFAAGKSATGFEHAFHDEKGNILSREEAAQRALDHGQISQEQFDKAMARTGEGNKGLHSEDLIEFQEKKKVTSGKPEFVLPKRAEAAGDKMVSVDIRKLDQGFAKDPQYVGEGQEDVPGRRAGVEKYLETGKPVETPEVSVSPDGKVTFINGRHRYAVLRDGGLKEMPVAMSEESIANARKNGLLKTDEPSPTAADEGPAQKTPVAKSDSLLDKLESLLTEEEPPAAAVTPQSAARKRVNDIQRDIENNADAEPAWKRRRQKDLKEAQKALAKEQEASSVGTEDSSPPLPAEPKEKETWQKTRDEIKDEGGSLTKHRTQTRAAVERGENVPLEVLESYSGYHWADKMRKEKYGEQVSDSFLTKIIDSLKDENGNLHFDPLFIQSVGKPALRGAVKLIREAVDAGGLAKDVMADVLQYIKAHTDTFDEAKTREFFQPVIDEALGGKEAPAEETAPPTEQPAPAEETAPPAEPPTPEPPITDSRMTGEGGESKTGTANAIVDRERQRRGEAPIFSEAKKALGETWDEATKAFDDNKNVGVELVGELNKKPRAVTAKEEAIMLREKVDVMNDLAKATETAISESANPEDRVASRVRAAVLMDQLNAIDEATRKAGTEWGRTGRFRQMLAAEDYSLSRMLQKKQLAMGEKWEKMSPEEKQKVEEQVKAMSDRIASLEKQLADFEAGHAERVEATRNAEADKAVQQMVSKAETPVDAYTRGVLEKIQAGLKSQADKARARIRERLGKASAGVDPVVVYDVAVIGAEKLFSTGLDFARWSSEMLSDLGESFKAYVSEDTFKQSQSINDKAIKKGAPKSVREKIKPKVPQTDAERQQNLVNRIAKKNKNGAREAIGSSIQQLAESFVRGGIREREPLIDAVHAAVKEALPEASRKDIRDAISGYGDYKKLSQDEAKVILRDLKGQMQQISKLEDMIQNKRLPAKTGVERREPSAEERQLLKEVNKIKKELGLESTDPTQLKGALDAAKTRARNRIEDLQRAIEKKEKIPKSDSMLKEDAELRDLNQQKAALQKEYDAVFETPKRTPDEIALAAYKARTKARIEELNDRTKRGDFSKKVRKPVELDPEGVKLRADAARAKLEFDRANYRDKQKNMSKRERFLDYIPKIARANLLSNPITLAKLFTAALWRLGASPFEEMIGGALGKIPYVREVAARAPREGGFNTKAEAKALTDAVMKGMKDAKDKLTKGETDLDVTSEKRSVIPHHWLDVFGNLHGAMKAPVVRAEFARSFEKRSAHAAANGVDITDPAVQIRIGLEAYRDSQRAIFQNDNRVVQIWNTAMRGLEHPSKETGRTSLKLKALQSAAKTILPIVKIPTNIVAEAFQYSLGSLSSLGRLGEIAWRGMKENERQTGSKQLGKAFAEGVKTLKPEEADLIMREMKKGYFGIAVMLLGYFTSQSVGGFYQPGQRRKDGDVKPGTVRVGGIDIPSPLLHNPLVDQLQVGATIGRVANSKLRKKDHETQGIPAGILASALGLVEEVPFLSLTAGLHKVFTPNERAEYFGELARSRVEPQVIQWMAQQTDKETPFSPFDSPRQRKPEGLKEEMEVGIPGLRQNVPLRRKRSWR